MQDEYSIDELGSGFVLRRWNGRHWQNLAWLSETDGEWYVTDDDRHVLIGDRGDAVDYLWENRETGGIAELTIEEAA